MAPAFLLPNDDSVFLVDLSFYLPQTVLVVRAVNGTDEMDSAAEPSITVAALPWNRIARPSERGVLALWSAPLRHPLVAHADPAHLLTVAQLADAGSGKYPLLLATQEEHVKRIYGSHGRA